MKYTYKQASLWAAFYALLALLPLVVVMLGERPAARDFWVEFGVGLGFVGMALMALQFVLTGRFRSFGEGFGIDNQLQFHKHMGLVGFAFIVAHPVVLFMYDSGYLVFFDPRANLPRALALTAVLGALGLIVGLTIWRKPLRIPYQWWRVSHGLLAAFVIFVGTVHILQVGHHVAQLWEQAVWVGMTVFVLGLFGYTRLYKPYQLSKKPWEVVEVRPERGRCWTLVLEPRGHAGLDFDPGQYCWLTVDESPYALEQHPFSLSSSATRARPIEITIKELGDFTRTVKDIAPGSTAFVEGPYGAFTLDADSREKAVFFAGGVGITPVMSILRTLAERGVRGEHLLFYAAPDLDTMLFRDDIDALADQIGLQVVYVVGEPPREWDGETGFVTAELIERYFPETDPVPVYYVCGPEPMMDVVETALLERGIDRRRIISERFEIV